MYSPRSFGFANSDGNSGDCQISQQSFLWRLWLLIEELKDNCWQVNSFLSEYPTSGDKAEHNYMVGWIWSKQKALKPTQSHRHQIFHIKGFSHIRVKRKALKIFLGLFVLNPTHIQEQKRETNTNSKNGEISPINMKKYTYVFSSKR